MQAFEFADLFNQCKASQRSYLEFLRVPSLSTGLYLLPANAIDGQQPHSEDEVYYIINGRGTIRVDDEDRQVGPGSVVFVGAGVTHHFHSITEDLAILVIFAPAEYSLAPTSV